MKEQLESLSKINSSIYTILKEIVKEKLNSLYPNLKEIDEVRVFHIPKDKQPIISVILHNCNSVDIKIKEIIFNGEDYQITGTQTIFDNGGSTEYDEVFSDEDFDIDSIGFDNLYSIAETLI